MGLERVRLRHHACHHSALCRIPTSPAILGRTYEAQCPTLNMLWHSLPANVGTNQVVEWIQCWEKKIQSPAFVIHSFANWKFSKYLLSAACVPPGRQVGLMTQSKANFLCSPHVQMNWQRLLSCLSSELCTQLRVGGADFLDLST